MVLWSVTWVSDYFTLSNVVSADDQDAAYDASRESLFEGGIPEDVLRSCFDATCEVVED